MPTKEQWDAAWEYNRWARARRKRDRRLLILLVTAHLLTWGWVIYDVSTG
jgi:hypothetical protein